MDIIYHPDLDTHFSDYGILIPLADDRSEKVFENLSRSFSNIRELNLSELPEITQSDLERVHNKDFVSRFYDEQKIEGELLSTYELIDHEGKLYRYRPEGAPFKLAQMRDSILKQVAATYLCLTKALENDFCYFLGGGMHHAMSFGGRGFCPVNDIAISIRKLQNEKRVQNVFVIDVDAHKGDGTAEIFHNDPTVKTLSIHMKSSWPLDSEEFDKFGKRNPWFIESDVELPVAEGEESSYLKILEEGLYRIASLSPCDLVVIVNGADPYELDELPSTRALKLDRQTMLKRDLMIYEFFKSKNIPQAYLMAGGYGKFSWEIYSQFLSEVLKARAEERVLEV